MSKKGQTYETYSEELKRKAVEMRLQGMTKAAVAEEPGIKDIGRLKVWMRKYRQVGEFGYVDHRGRRQNYIDQERYIKRLEMENAGLKKWLDISKGEVYRTSIASSKNYKGITPSISSVSKHPHRALVEATYYKYDGRYGYRQLQLFIFQDHGIWLNHKKVLRLMQSLNLRARIRRKHRCNYTSTVGGRVAENLLQRQFQADKPNQKWVTDVTQFRVGDTWLYLSAIKDLFNTQRPRFPVHVLRLPRHAAKGWRPNQHVSSRQLL